MSNRLLAAILLTMSAGNAHAYIDPGSGMLLLQGFLAALGALIVFVKHPIQSIRNLINSWRNKK